MVFWLSRKDRQLSGKVQLYLENLENRLVMDIQGLPILHSMLGAPTAVYLDFNGYGSNRPYDEDGDPTSFNPTEQAHITEAWRQVSDYFAMFDTDVTTEHPTVPFAWDLISNSISGGYSYVGTFPNSSPQSFNESSDARTRESGLAHEIGHNFGLQHQSDYDLNGNKTNEYSSGYDNLHGPIMGVDYARSVHKWFIGHPSTSPSSLQDDMAVISSKIRRYESPGGDGFRPKTTGNTIDTATPLDDYGTFQYTWSVLARLTDQDAFSFTADGNPIRIDAVRDAPSPLHLKLDIYQSDGTLLAEVDDPNSTDAHLNMTLPADTYYAVVSSHGDYGDVGAYSLIVSAGTPDNTPNYNDLSSPTNLSPSLGTGTEIDLGWDAVDGAAGYTVERSANGVNWTQIATTDPNTTTYADVGRAGSYGYFYRVSALDDSGLGSVPSAVAYVVNAPSAPFNVTVSSWQTTRLIVNWRDVVGDTGYRIERSTDRVNFTPVATVGTNVTSFTNSGLTAGTTYYYQIIALSPYGESLPSPIATGTTRTAAPGPNSSGGDTGTSALATSFPAGLDASLGTIARQVDGQTPGNMTVITAPTTEVTSLTPATGDRAEAVHAGAAISLENAAPVAAVNAVATESIPVHGSMATVGDVDAAFVQITLAQIDRELLDI